MLKHYIVEPHQLQSNHYQQIQRIIDKIVSEKKDEYWRNYQNFSIKEQVAISLGFIDDEVKIFSSVYNRAFFGPDVYRILNRYVVAEDSRELSGTKTYEGGHRIFPMINQQIQFVNTLNPKFYFISRQRENTRWMKYYFDEYNKEYNTNLVVSDDQYWVCPNKKDKYGCCQTIVYPKDKYIPFEIYRDNPV
tara:strand:+ start:3223 stop:3795 length:573 start_codon:yes stop_codon:yes gene_type:complete